MELSEELVGEIRQVADNYPNARSAIMPALYLAQAQYQYLETDVLRAVAVTLDVPEIWVFELATFYTMYHTEPVGKYHIQLCTNVSCLLGKAEHLKQYMEERLQIETGETTEDGKFTLSKVECIGSCDKAPAMMVNQDYYENLDQVFVEQIIDRLMVQSSSDQET